MADYVGGPNHIGRGAASETKGTWGAAQIRVSMVCFVAEVRGKV